MSGELIKNFGLGLLVNGIFALFHGEVTLTVFLINAISVYLMVIGIILEKE